MFHSEVESLTFLDFADSVPSSSDTTGSIVLLGSGDWHEQSEPEVIPELQDLGVIK